MPHPLLFPLLATVLVVSWSSGFVGIRYATDGATVAQVLFWRSAVSGVLLLPLVLLRPPRITLAMLGEQSVYAFLGMFLYLGGFAMGIGQRVPTGLVALMSDLVPLAIAALSAPLLGQPLTRWQWLGMGLGTAGVLMVSADALSLGDAPLWAYALPIAGMLAFALSIVAQERRRATDLPILHRLCLQCLIAALMFAPFAHLSGGLAPPPTPRFAFGIGWLVLLATYGGWLTYYLGLRLYPAALISSTIYLSPPLTMLWAWALFAEPLTWPMALGAAVTLAGVAMVALTPRPA
jgi:drug/metabolite transporter (DMT)-like permease